MSGSQIELQLATVDDIDEIDALNRACLPENYPKEFFENFVNYAGSCVVLARQKSIADDANDSKENENETAPEKGQLVGYLMAMATRDQHGRLVSQIYSIAVDENFRKRNIGTAMMAVNEQVMQKKYGITRYSLHVRKKNKTAHAFYAKRGFGRSKVVKNYYKQPKEDAHVMTKILERQQPDV